MIDTYQPNFKAHDYEELSNEENDEINFTKDQIGANHKINSIAMIEALCIKPLELTLIRILLCQMLVMPLVKPTFALDLTLLEDDFVHDYRNGIVVFYVPTTNK
jgi:hypothetical protein